jgi:hypothetical protein
MRALGASWRTGTRHAWLAWAYSNGRSITPRSWPSATAASSRACSPTSSADENARSSPCTPPGGGAASGRRWSRLWSSWWPNRVARRLWVLTTNDNVDALRFYQRRGFRLAGLNPGAVDGARATLKPEIPVVGAHGIPLRDELVLDKRL